MGYKDVFTFIKTNMVHRKFAGKNPSRMEKRKKNKGKPIQVTEVENCFKTLNLMFA